MFRTIRRSSSGTRAPRRAARRCAAILAVLLALASAGDAFALAQRTGDFELEIDAPWRVEPRGIDESYGTIPIQVSIHDADQPATVADGVLQRIIYMKQGGYTELDAVFTFLVDAIRSVLGPLVGAIEDVLGIQVLPLEDLQTVTLNQFRRLDVYEEIDGRFVLGRSFTLSNVHEVEQTVGLWQYAANQTGPETPFAPPPRPTHTLCRRWQGQSCAGFASLRPTSEWNLTALYQPTEVTPGRDVRLRASLVVTTVEGGVSRTRTFSRELSVHLGEEPLPKFDTDWAYGDLHYHAQGTDNDGESGYAYRGVLQAMGAMGLDFAFATDHASNSPQIGSATPIPTFELIQPIQRGLRDLSPDRFAFDLGLLNGTAGANREVTSHPRPIGAGQLAAPQLFLGSEVDVIPEFATTAPQSGIEACNDVPTMLKVLDQKTVLPINGEFIGLDDYWCDTMEVSLAGNRSLLYDVQGPSGGRLLSSRFHGRQHLLHLPVDGADADAFIPSNTSKYGGATRRFGEILDLELAQRRKGYVFLAHPFEHAEGEDVDRLGPDLWPYSPAQLEDALASPYVLGLQIWNENPLRSATANDRRPFLAPAWQKQHQPSHFYDFRRWDILQLYGLDRNRTSKLSWLPSGQPRRVFAAGGSDAHGDWNYRRKGFFFGTSSATDTVMGSPRNLVRVGAPAASTVSSASGTGQPLSQSQVIDGLRSGNFAVTDGPAVRVAIDVNGNGVIDSYDTPMGGVRSLTRSAPFRVIVEWLSTPEFAPVREVDVMLGVWAAGIIDGMVYTRSYDGPIANADNTYVHPETGRTFVKTPNWPYWYDPTNGKLRITVGAGEGYRGRRVLTIDPNDFPVGRDACILEDGAFRSATAGTTSTTPSSGATVVYLQQSLDAVMAEIESGVIEPPPNCIRREFQDPRRPDRLFVRAEVRNHVVPGTPTACTPVPGQSLPQCVYRQAFSNPVWVDIQPCLDRVCGGAAELFGPEATVTTTSPSRTTTSSTTTTFSAPTVSTQLSR